MSCNCVGPVLASYRRMKLKSEYLICFVLYPQSIHGSSELLCKTRVPWTVHPGNKNLLELSKHFHTSISKGINQTIQEFSHPFKCLPQMTNSHPLIKHSTQVSSNILEPPGLLPPLGSLSKEGVTAPGHPQDLETACRDQALRP